jgi:hypothetical protein
VKADNCGADLTDVSNLIDTARSLVEASSD